MADMLAVWWQGLLITPAQLDRRNPCKIRETLSSCFLAKATMMSYIS